MDLISNYFPLRRTELWIKDAISETIRIYSDNDLALISYHLNEIGSYIWERCDGKLSVEEIAHQLLQEITERKPDFNTLLTDLHFYLSELKKQKLITWEEPTNVEVLLVVPPFPSMYSQKVLETPEYSAPPLGLAYLASSLLDSSIGVQIYDMHIENSYPESIITKCREVKPKIVGITATTPTFPNALKLAKILKIWNEDIVIVLGGPHPTTSPRECLIDNAVDYVVIGEGEISFTNLAKTIINKGAISKVKGIAYKKDLNEIVFTPGQKRLTNLDALTYPARHLLNLNAYYQKGSIISSRGCPHKCNYCACASISGYTNRTHSVNYVLDEIEYLQKEYNLKYFDFHDDTFNLIAERVFEFCNSINKRKLKFKWGCFCRVSNFTYDMAVSMKKAGCEVIQFGIESGNQKVLDSIHKKITKEEIEKAIIAAKRACIKQINCGFIIGHPEDTELSANETIDFGVKLSDLGATRLAISVLTPYPGTEVYDNMHENGVKLIETDWEQFIFSRVVIETANLSRDKLREIFTRGVCEFLQVSK